MEEEEEEATGTQPPEYFDLQGKGEDEGGK